MYLEFHPVKKTTDHGKFTSLPPRKRTRQRKITIFNRRYIDSNGWFLLIVILIFPVFSTYQKFQKTRPPTKNNHQSTPDPLEKGKEAHLGVRKSDPKAGCGFDHHLRVLEVPMITQSNIRSAVFRPGGAISFELLVLWFYLVLHLMKEWGRFVGCGMGCGGSMIFSFSGGGG